MNVKQYAIETFEIAEWNVLKAIFRLHPEDFVKELLPGYNTIKWILIHLSIQMDYFFNGLCRGERSVTTKELETGSIKKIIETFLQVSDTSFTYLRNLSDEQFSELPAYNKNNTESIYEIIQRVALHFLGHTGQIYWIKKSLGKGGAFVMGIKKKARDASRSKWLKWWQENKEKYSK